MTGTRDRGPGTGMGTGDRVPGTGDRGREIGEEGPGARDQGPAPKVPQSLSPLVPSTPLLWIGAFLPTASGSRSASEDVALRLAEHGFVPQFTSRYRSGVFRAVDIASTVLRRRDLAAAHVDLYSGAAFRWAELATRLLAARGVAMVGTLHGGGLSAFAKVEPIRVARVLARLQGVVAPSPWLARELGGLRAGIEVIPNGLDLEQCLEYEAVSAVSQARISWVRAFAPTYRPELAVAAVAELLARGVDARLVMTGPDKGALAATREAAARLGAGDRVELRPAVPKGQVAERIAEGNVFLSTSAVDNTPVTVLEAMACGRPVVAVDVGGLRDVLDDGREGLLVGESVGAIADGIERLMREHGLAARLATAGRARAAGHDWSVVMPRWVELFRGVVG